MRTVQVNLDDRSYPIYIGPNLLNRPDLFKNHILGNQAVVITNDTLKSTYAQPIVELIGEFVDVSCYAIADGEIHKNLTTVSNIFDYLLEVPCDRNTTLIAVGGGVVGDITGFAAACYQRGVPFIQVPTTLLAQVDSSVGGKTGVNHPLGKNMIGAIYQPQCVIADTETLTTLSDRELRAGLAEVIKYGLIRDPDFFRWLENNVDRLLARDSNSLTYAIEQSCRNKAEVVREDERETGVRATLNFGHTFGHAIENKLKYKDWLHGEGVAAGMVMATDFSNRLNGLNQTHVEQVIQILTACDLPVSPPGNMSLEDFLDAMSLDKKVTAGNIRIIALESIGKAQIVSDYPKKILEDTILTAIARSVTA